MFRGDAVRKLVRHFADPAVGCVSGDVQLVNAAEEFARSEGAYYRYERFIQRQESALGAIVGADGGMYALRHSLFAPIPDEVVVDDFVISMNVARAGFAVRYEPDAIAIEQGTLSPEEEFHRKVRVISGGIQALKRRVGLPRLSQPRLWWCYLSHKLGRWLVPVALVVMGIASVLSTDLVVRLLAVGQAAFYSAALIHRPLVKAGWNLPVTTIPYYFCLMNGAAGVGLWRGLRGRQRAAWNRTTRESGVQPSSAGHSRPS
jgi:cellulose synthase/poly-beta-1,6-N-acetylglucosamine synthase-like glycosyltransferase